MNSPSKGSLFSLFRETFWRSAALPASSHESDQPVRNVASTSGESSSHRKPGLHHKALKALDLRALPRDEGPPTELRARRDKFAYFEQECTKVVDGLYLGADSVARNWDTLEAAGITHVVNCVGFIYPAYFEDRLSYKTLYLQGDIYVLPDMSLKQLLSSFTSLSKYTLVQILQERILQLYFMTPLTSLR